MKSAVKQHFPYLFSTINIGPVKLKNRLVMPPMTTNFAAANGAVTDQMRAYYARRARGGVALIIVEASYIKAGSRHAFLNAAGIYEDNLISGYRSLTDSIHSYGAKVFLQLLHAGPATSTYIAGAKPVAPSPIGLPEYEIPRELTVAEIEEVVDCFVEATRRAKDAGFDGVELHGAHDYLLARFMSPAFNKRNDEYGNTVYGRTKIVIDIIKQAKERVGSDFPITVRFNGEEIIPGGLRLTESVMIAKIMQNAGAAALHISSGLRPDLYPADIEAPLVPLAGTIKKEVNIPVIAVGRILHPSLAEEIIHSGKADMISMGRALLADPDLPKKAAKGQLDDLRECVLCRSCQRTDVRPQVNCLVNFELGRENVTKFKITKARRRKKVLIIGGGPGGMEAARVAALRGHDVTLYEREQQLGGQLKLASIAPTKERLNLLINYLSRQVEKLGVNVKLGVALTPELVVEHKPEVVIIATGSVPKQINFPIVESMNESPNLVTARDVLASKAYVGKYVLIVGAGATGAEVAETLARQGKGVTLIDELPRVAEDMEEVKRRLLISRMAEENILTYTSTRVKRIIGKQVILSRDVPTFDARVSLREQVLDGIDSIVLAVGSLPDNSIASAIKNMIPEVYVIGDAAEPRSALEAIHEGSKVGRTI